jgi:hypothetical protein
MKLRIKGNSLRLRITPKEMMRLLDTGRVEETIYFAAEENARLTYALEHTQAAPAMTVRWGPREVVVAIASEEARRWAATADVGLYGEVTTSHGNLELAIEKDFACLDKSDAENTDTFPNPGQGIAC